MCKTVIEVIHYIYEWSHVDCNFNQAFVCSATERAQNTCCARECQALFEYICWTFLASSRWLRSVQKSNNFLDAFDWWRRRQIHELLISPHAHGAGKFLAAKNVGESGGREANAIIKPSINHCHHTITACKTFTEGTRSDWKRCCGKREKIFHLVIQYSLCEKWSGSYTSRFRHRKLLWDVSSKLVSLKGWQARC